MAYSFPRVVNGTVLQNDTHAGKNKQAYWSVVVIEMMEEQSEILMTCLVEKAGGEGGLGPCC